MIEENPSDNNSKEDAQQGGGKGTEASHVQPLAPPANAQQNLTSNSGSNQPETETKETIKPAEKHALVLAWAGFIVAVFTLVIFFKQFREMQRQTLILNNQVKQAIKDSVELSDRLEHQLSIAQEQVGATQSQVKAVTRQMRQDQRAWMRVTIGMGEAIENKITHTIHIELPLIISNIGKTPARRVVTRAIIEKVPSEESPTFRYANAATLVRVSGIMFPRIEDRTVVPFLQKTATGFEDRLLTSAEHQELRDGKFYFVGYAETRYLDIFNVEHWVRYCGYISMSAKPDLPLILPACTNYNDADNN